MLKVLRDSMKYLAWILWVVIAVFILFVFVDFGGGLPGAQPNRAAATVGHETVTYRELEREHRSLENQWRERLGDQYSPEMAERLQLPMQALNQVIDRKVMLAEARKMDLTISDEEVRRYILDLPVFNDGGRFVGQEAYDRFLRRNDYTPESFETAIRTDLLLNRFLSTVESSMAVSDRIIEERYRDQVERAAIRYVALPGTQLRSEVQPTPAEIEAHFESHREDYRVPEERIADYLLINTRTLRDSLEIPEADIAAFYAEHEEDYFETEQVRARHILIGTSERSAEEAREMADSLYARIQNGEDFAALARESSDDTGSGARGGDLGYFGRGRMVAPFEEAVFGATPPALLEPVETQFGYHIIEVQDRREERQRPLEEVTELISNRIAADRASSRAEELIREIHEELGGDSPRSLAEIAAGNEAFETGATRPIRPEGSVLPLGNAPALNPQVFALEVGGITEPTQIGRGWALLQLSEVRPEHLPELTEVRGLVRRDVVEARAAELALERLVAARDAAESADDVIAAVADEVGQTVVESPSFRPGGNIPGLGAAGDVVTAIFDADEGAMGEPVVVDGKAVLYEVVQRHRFSREELDLQRDNIRRQILQEQLQTTISSLVNQRKEELGVEYDRRLLESWDMVDGAEPG